MNGQSYSIDIMLTAISLSRVSMLSNATIRSIEQTLHAQGGDAATVRRLRGRCYQLVREVLSSLGRLQGLQDMQLREYIDERRIINYDKGPGES
jgi:hypothetical protein